VETYLVGGAVRDGLLGLEAQDRDYVVVGSSIEEMIALGFKQVGSHFPVFLHPETGEEYALARTESKTGGGHCGFTCAFGPDVTLEEDLMRRDLTINAMAIPTVADASLVTVGNVASLDIFGSGSYIIDPFNGMADLQTGVLRHTSDAFTDDPLRVYRVARLAATLEFDVAPETLALMDSMQSSLFGLSVERVTQEMIKALTATRPSKFFEILEECELLSVHFGDLNLMIGVPAGPEQYHGDVDAFDHSMYVLDEVSTMTSHLPTRFAALTHDVGKGITPEDQWPHHYDHHETGAKIVRIFCNRLKLPNIFRNQARLAAQFHRRVRMFPELRPGKMLALIEKLNCLHTLETLDLVLNVADADARCHVGGVAAGGEMDYARSMMYEAVAVVRAVDCDSIIKNADYGNIGELIQTARIDALSSMKRRLKK